LLAAFATDASADTIYFSGTREPLAGPNVIRDTMRGYAWADRDGKNADRAEPWAVTWYRFGRNRGQKAQAFEDTWNKVASKGFNGSWQSIGKDIDSALAMKAPDGYGDIQPMQVRLLYYKLRAAAELGQDIAGPLAEYVKANVEYAKKVEKDNQGVTGRKFKGAPYDGCDVGTLHGTTIDAFMAIAVYQLGVKKDPNAAYEQGYKPAADLATQLSQATSQQNYIKLYAAPVLERAGTMFSDSGVWDKAAEVYDQISKATALAGDQLASKAARMKNARCLIKMGGAGINRADSIFRPIVKEYEETVRSDGPPKKDWLTPEKAAYYAAAYTGIGLIRMEEGKFSEALQQFSRALAFFSADAEVRADALFNAGMCAAKIQETTGSKSRYYFDLGSSYYGELKGSYEDTEAGRKAGVLREALDKNKPAGS